MFIELKNTPLGWQRVYVERDMVVLCIDEPLLLVVCKIGVLIGSVESRTAGREPARACPRVAVGEKE